MTSPPAASEPVGAWSPLSFSLFRWVWLATLVSNVGVWFQDVAAGWLMTSLNSSPMLVSMVQAATTLPLLLFGLPAGALADLLDRRKLLLVMTWWMTLTAAALAAFQISGTLNEWGLLLLVFAVSMGTAMSAPAWQAIVPELVPRTHLAPAVALNGLGINISRAVGPALAGLVLSTMGAGVAFAVNAVSFLAVVMVLWRWRRQQTQQDLPPEQFLFAMSAGLRYVGHAPAFRAVLVRSFSFAAFAVALWAMLPLVTRELLGGNAGDYGLMLAAIGAGAVCGALILPKLRTKLAKEVLCATATTLYAGVMAGLATAPPLWVAMLLMLPAGFAWITLLSSLHVSAQILLPSWVRARGLSVSLMVFFGSMSLGSLFWGAVGAQIGLAATLTTAAVALFVIQFSALRYKLPQGSGPNLVPSRHWPAPAPELAQHDDNEPVQIMITYEVSPDNEKAFFEAAEAVRLMRMRSGAFGWRIYHDPDRPGLLVESFFNRNWMDHLRLHERVTEDDRAVQDRLIAFHQGNEAPKVVHLIGKKRPT